MGPSLLGLLSIINALHMIRCWIISVPTTVTAVEGSCAVVPCHTQPHARVIWYKYHNVKYPVVCDGLRPYQVEPPFRGRTYVVGKAANGNCTLKITDVKMADNNLQIYVWINPDSTATQKFYDQIVTISVEKKIPMIFVQSEILIGSIFEVNCSIEHSCPYFPPLFSWSRSQVLNNMTSLTFSAKRGVLWIYRETLQGTATKDMHKTQIRCSAQLGSLTTTSPEITLNVLDIPATVKIEMETDTVIEGGSITAVCAANSNPQPHKYSWIRRQMGNYSKISSTWRRMSFKNITRHTSLSCMAHNDIGVGQSDWMDLIVHYPPTILPESSCSLIEDLLGCFCHVEAFPNASISWDFAENYSLPSSFTTIYSIRQNVVSGEMKLPITNNTTIWCKARNEFGSDTKLLYFNSTSNTSSSLMWLLWLMIVGIILLLGGTIFIKQKLTRNRSQHSPVIVQLEHQYFVSLRDPDPSSYTNQQRPERTPQENSYSCVYDNDCVEEMRASMGLQQHKNKPVRNKESEIQPVENLKYEKGVYCMDD